jgi:tRNA/tmRNA/rRNA uracil-C5-methylase (TrmA/RlmC/RlmD family)
MSRSGQHRRRATIGEGGDVNAVIIDPHRKGLDTVVSEYHSMQPEAWVLHRHRLAR